MEIEECQQESVWCIAQTVQKDKLSLELVQNRMLTNLNDPNLIGQEWESLHMYQSLLQAEESFFRQKARIRCLNLGDHNTFFFLHKSVSIRSARNTIICFYGN